ncbi:hypothetical protein M427DRAFT_61656 [Gonapodya prolifera JEL478]|uniref:Uncharacterized protein n=1 Tax=Gonapodya prolifera (strain JEL478) TaxID=1344416 RepID=A0A139A1P1_GONPJ|nr:hypothetical protein M427DRAFT_61656 [Gonapodya prolifera JEL478]|eukprot:KXS10710.1 hypothetical protein M427DRAFT_61656 [Gonapodya prolifera JEL478]
MNRITLRAGAMGLPPPVGIPRSLFSDEENPVLRWLKESPNSPVQLLSKAVRGSRTDAGSMGPPVDPDYSDYVWAMMHDPDLAQASSSNAVIESSRATTGTLSPPAEGHDLPPYSSVDPEDLRRLDNEARLERIRLAYERDLAEFNALVMSSDSQDVEPASENFEKSVKRGDSGKKKWRWGK